MSTMTARTLAESLTDSELAAITSEAEVSIDATDGVLYDVTKRLVNGMGFAVDDPDLAIIIPIATSSLVHEVWRVLALKHLNLTEK